MINKYVFLGEDHLFLELYAKVNWEQTRIHASLPPHALHTEWPLSLGRDGMGRKAQFQQI